MADMRGPSRFLRRWVRGVRPPAGPWALPADPAGFRVFLLMGQSNMAGYGAIHPSDPWQPGDFSPVPRVLVLGGQCSVKSRRPRGWMRWQAASHPLHLNQRSAGFGLGLPFASRLLESDPSLVIGLVPCAWGGAGIDQIGPGTPIYDNAITRARMASTRGTLAGVLWHQGETDALDETLARSHARKLSDLIARLRTDLDSPDLPVLIGDLAHFGDEKREPAAIARRDEVRTGLRRVAAETPRAGFVESDGLPGVDGVHFSRAALMEFGRRYAEGYGRIG
ncbi:sialate O-acetylesterase [Luteolibacter flavescens]|uniref:Sialate O-acetylesterase n=1 Tax=Luteolibacter flavescens TaxID=1859460 RepID=A0ABT3FK17_9BACT|nr:sialate O-acetylesterase [Luteolibacter flavescens]MCW1883914.1 sialate O-acetylesterase [Luteolibacter flavescens]